METGEKLAIFDFCETLIQFQTADAFINYVYEQTHSGRMRCIEKAKNLFYTLRLPRLLNRFSGLWEKKSLNKKWRLYELRGLGEQELDNLARRFYRERLLPNIIGPVVEELQEKKRDGWKVGIVSGGFDLYIRLFAEEYGVDFILASTIGFKRGKCTGRLVGPDCMREQKVVEIQRLYPVPPAESVSYSDSRSDLPILSWASRGVVVSRGRHQEWVDDYQFHEIIWQQG